MNTNAKHKLYTYWRSSAAYRVRIGLALKKVEWDALPVDLSKGKQREVLSAHNPQHLVPTLITPNGALSQSLSILEYLEEVYPEPPLLPTTPFERAKVRSMSHLIAMELHPLNNLRVLRYLSDEFKHSEQEKLQWYQHWLKVNFVALEKCIQENSNGDYCFGDKLSLADVCLVPQVYNANRFKFPVKDYPFINSVWQHCTTLESFQSAAPEQQLDFTANK